MLGKVNSKTWPRSPRPFGAIVAACSLAIFGAAAALFPSCGWKDAEADLPCRQAAQAIAQRTIACVGDQALANRRYDDFLDRYECRASNPIVESDYACSIELGELTCVQVASFREELDKWGAQIPACRKLLVPPADASWPDPDASKEAETADSIDALEEETGLEAEASEEASKEASGDAEEEEASGADSQDSSKDTEAGVGDSGPSDTTGEEALLWREQEQGSGRAA